MCNALKRIFELMSFFVRLLVFEIWSILYSTFVVNWGLGEIFEPENLIQKRKSVISENQLARGIQSKSTRGVGAKPPSPLSHK